MAQAQADRRAANPLKKQLESAEAHHARVVKKLADSKAAQVAMAEQLAHVAKQIEISGTKAKQPRDLTQEEKEKGTVDGLEDGRELTTYEVETSKLLVANNFTGEQLEAKKAELDSLRERRESMKEDLPY